MPISWQKGISGGSVIVSNQERNQRTGSVLVYP